MTSALFQLLFWTVVLGIGWATATAVTKARCAIKQKRDVEREASHAAKLTLQSEERSAAEAREAEQYRINYKIAEKRVQEQYPELVLASVVRLKSGGQAMTVVGRRLEWVYCQWMSHGEMRTAEVLIEHLVPA